MEEAVFDELALVSDELGLVGIFFRRNLGYSRFL